MNTPRTCTPSFFDKNYINAKHGGLNECKNIKDGFVLPNCTGYAWGRWCELLGKKHNLSVANAGAWYWKADGYDRGQEPKPGACICWLKDPLTAAGHVAIVEHVSEDGTILVSQSAYKGNTFEHYELKPPYNYRASGYTLQGFIYLPKEIEMFYIGDKVIYTGDVYSNSKATSKAGHRTDYVGTITRYVAGAPHPYTIDEIGWIDEDGIRKYEPDPPTPPEPDPKVKCLYRITFVVEGEEEATAAIEKLKEDGFACFSEKSDL